MTTMQNNTNLGKAFNDLMNSVFIRYNGVLVEKTGDGFKVGDTFYPTWDEMVKGRNEIRKIIYKSIIKPRP
jgi:hypothetical protein